MATRIERRRSFGNHPLRPSLAGRRDPLRPRRRVGPAGRVVVIGTVCLVLWGLLAAPALRRAAETAPLGLRRTAALAVLRPLSRLSSLMALDRVQTGVDSALGRHDSGAPALPPEDVLPPPALPAHPSSGPRTRASPPARANPNGTPAPAATPGPLTVGTAPRLPTPSEAGLRVLVVGDSIGADLAMGLARLLDARGGYVTKMDARQATGLARPDYFDWERQVAADLQRFHPDLVVAMFGANDDQGFLVRGGGVAFGTADWQRVYGQRVARIMAEVTAWGRPLIWVGMPPMKSDSLTAAMRTVNAIFRGQALAHPGVLYVDPWVALAGPRSHYAAYLPNDSGQQELVRAADGVHLTAAGGARLAGSVFTAMRMLWAPPGPSSSPPPTAPSPPSSGPPVHTSPQAPLGVPGLSGRQG